MKIKSNFSTIIYIEELCHPEFHTLSKDYCNEYKMTLRSTLLTKYLTEHDFFFTLKPQNRYQKITCTKTNRGFNEILF